MNNVTEDLLHVDFTKAVPSEYSQMETAFRAQGQCV